MTEQCGGVAVMKPEGPITWANAEEFKAEMSESIGKNLGRVVLDATLVSYVDSKGLGVLVELTQTLAQSGKTLKLCHVNETVSQVIELTGLRPLFECFDDINSAVRSFL
jgi:anti-sigma B factor antagonist